MSEQNRYQISWNEKNKREWTGWSDSDWILPADNWQDAIQKGLDNSWASWPPYKVASETPSEDGRSGIITIQYNPPEFWVEAKIKATLIEN